MPAYSGFADVPMGWTGESGPDGNRYFRVLGPPPGMLEAYRVGAALQTQLRARRDAYGIAQFVQVTAILRTFKAEVDVVASQVAATATGNIVKNIRSTAVRPSQGRNRVVSLEDAIVSRPLPLGGLPSGMVGIGDMSVLDTVVGPDGQPYWRAQEFGSDHLVGNVYRGFFMPSGTVPSGQYIRQDADFLPAPGGGKMMVQNPIMERSFLRRGIEAAATVRHTRLNGVKAGLLTAIRAAERGATVADVRAAFRLGRGKLGR